MGPIALQTLCVLCQAGFTPLAHSTSSFFSTVAPLLHQTSVSLKSLTGGLYLLHQPRNRFAVLTGTCSIGSGRICCTCFWQRGDLTDRWGNCLHPAVTSEGQEGFRKEVIFLEVISPFECPRPRLLLESFFHLVQGTMIQHKSNCRVVEIVFCFCVFESRFLQQQKKFGFEKSLPRQPHANSFNWTQAGPILREYAQD